MTKPNGILIFGANGSGKTTLGREIAQILNFKHIDHEDYAFEESEIPYTLERSKEDYLRLMIDDINKHSSFVISAVIGDFGEEITQYYDLAICLSAPLELRLQRISQRGVERFGERVEPSGDMHKQQAEFINFVAKRPISRCIDEWAKMLACPILHIDSTRDYKEIAAEIINYYTTERHKFS